MPLNKKKQVGQAYEALLDALTYISSHDRSDNRSVRQHVYDNLNDHPDCPEVVSSSIAVVVQKELFVSITATFIIDGEQVKVSTESAELVA